MNLKRLPATSLLSITTLTMTSNMQPQASASLSQRRDALKKLLDEQWQYTMRESPEYATVVGDYRYNDRWSDASLVHIAQQNEDAKRFLARFGSDRYDWLPRARATEQRVDDPKSEGRN
jgi:uncharacterized protein (DUF885 family)